MANLLLVFEMAVFEFSLSWSLCFESSHPLSSLVLCWLKIKILNKSRFQELLYKDKSVLRGKSWTFLAGPLPPIFAVFVGPLTTRYKYTKRQRISVDTRRRDKETLQHWQIFIVLLTYFTRDDYIKFYFQLKSTFFKKRNVANLLLVFEMAVFEFSLSWSLCFESSHPLSSLVLCWLKIKILNKSRFQELLYKDKSVLRGKSWTNSLLFLHYSSAFPASPTMCDVQTNLGGPSQHWHNCPKMVEPFSGDFPTFN